MPHQTKAYLAWLADMHRTGRMDCRQFLGRAAAAGLVEAMPFDMEKRLAASSIENVRLGSKAAGFDCR